MSIKNKEKNFKGEILSKPKKVKLDLIDRKILYLLSLNSRFSHTAISNALKIRREVVAYRIKRFAEEDFLHGFFALIDVSKIGYQLNMVYIKLLNTTTTKEIFEYLESIPEITRIKECAGIYDIQIIFSTKNIAKFDESLDVVLTHMSLIIRDYDILRIVEEDYTGLELLLSANERSSLSIKDRKGSSFSKEFSQQSSDVIGDIDDNDKKILRLLQLNANMQILELSKKVKIAPIAITNRLRKLIASGIIRHTYPLFDVSQMGYQWHKVFFQVRDLKKSEFVSYLRNHDNILWYMKLIGKWNYQFSVFARDNIELHTILNDIRSKFSGKIVSYDTLMILHQHKFVHRID